MGEVCIMTIMVDREIRQAIHEKSLIVSPLDWDLINPASLDFRLGSTFGAIIPTGGVRSDIVNPLDKTSFETVYFQEDCYFDLAPNEFIVATSLETFDFKGTDEYGIAAEVKGKSSLGRLGLGNSSQAGFIDCGFNSFITLELKNDSANWIRLTPGMKIGQLILFKTEVPKKDYKLTGRYNGQSAAEGSKGI
jgi:dCTP deaminase